MTPEDIDAPELDYPDVAEEYRACMIREVMHSATNCGPDHWGNKHLPGVSDVLFILRMLWSGGDVRYSIVEDSKPWTWMRRLSFK